jgi:two-component system sensor histidine kinase HydH
MDARSQSALLLAIVTLAVSVAMMLRPARSRLFTHFAVLNANLCAWAIGLFWSAFQPTSIVPLRWVVSTEAALPATALAFFLEFLGESGPQARRGLRVALTMAGLALVVSLTQAVGIKLEGWNVYPVRFIVGLYAFAMNASVVSLLYSRMRRSISRTERARLLYLVVGAGLTLGLVALELLTRDIAFPPLGTVALTVFMYFLSQTLLRHRLLDLNELLGKVIVLSLLALLLAGIYGALVSWSVSVSHNKDSWAGLFAFNTLVASFVILILFDPLRGKVESTVVSFLFRERWAFLQTLQQLKQRMASLIELRDLGQIMLDTIYETRRVTHVSFYLLSDDGLGFRRVDFRGPPPAPYLDAATARGIVASVGTGQKALLIENVERRLFELRSLLPGAAGVAPLPPGPAAEEALRLSEIGAALAAMRAGVCIPILGGDRVVGFLNLHDDRVPEAFASDEIALMLEVAEQAAITVENSRLFEKMKERDRLAALGEMAAGLAHEIRNPLSSIKGAVQFLDPKLLPPEDAEIMTVIIDEVNRLNSVVTQFLEYSRPLRSTFTTANINDLLTRTMKLLSGHELPVAVQVRMDLGPDLPQVKCDADQLKQVFINLALNAVQAMPSGGTLTITTRRPRSNEWRIQDDAPRAIGDQVEIRFADTGEGISEEVRQHIFVPFYTTKKKGTGLGLAICQRIVKNHGGTVEVESKIGDGTQFILRVPTNADKPVLEGTPLPSIKPTLAQELDGTPVPEIRPAIQPN